MSSTPKVKWTELEIERLKTLVGTVGEQNLTPDAWTTIATHFAKRNAKQCRERWVYHMRSDVTHSTDWETEDELQLFALQKSMGNRWKDIAARLPHRRSETACKNRFYSAVRRIKRSFGITGTNAAMALLHSTEGELGLSSIKKVNGGLDIAKCSARVQAIVARVAEVTGEAGARYFPNGNGRPEPTRKRARSRKGSESGPAGDDGSAARQSQSHRGPGGHVPPRAPRARREAAAVAAASIASVALATLEPPSLAALHEMHGGHIPYYSGARLHHHDGHATSDISREAVAAALGLDLPSMSSSGVMGRGNGLGSSSALASAVSAATMRGLDINASAGLPSSHAVDHDSRAFALGMSAEVDGVSLPSTANSSPVGNGHRSASCPDVAGASELRRGAASAVGRGIPRPSPRSTATSGSASGSSVSCSMGPHGVYSGLQHGQEDHGLPSAGLRGQLGAAAVERLLRSDYRGGADHRRHQLNMGRPFSGIGSDSATDLSASDRHGDLGLTAASVEHAAAAAAAAAAEHAGLRSPSPDSRMAAFAHARGAGGGHGGDDPSGTLHYGADGGPGRPGDGSADDPRLRFAVPRTAFMPPSAGGYGSAPRGGGLMHHPAFGPAGLGGLDDGMHSALRRELAASSSAGYFPHHPAVSMGGQLHSDIPTSLGSSSMGMPALGTGFQGMGHPDGFGPPRGPGHEQGPAQASMEPEASDGYYRLLSLPEGSLLSAASLAAASGGMAAVLGEVARSSELARARRQADLAVAAGGDPDGMLGEVAFPGAASAGASLVRLFDTRFRSSGRAPKRTRDVLDMDSDPVTLADAPAHAGVAPPDGGTALPPGPLPPGGLSTGSCGGHDDDGRLSPDGGDFASVVGGLSSATAEAVRDGQDVLRGAAMHGAVQSGLAEALVSTTLTPHDVAAGTVSAGVVIPRSTADADGVGHGLTDTDFDPGAMLLVPEAGHSASVDATSRVYRGVAATHAMAGDVRGVARRGEAAWADNVPGVQGSDWNPVASSSLPLHGPN